MTTTIHRNFPENRQGKSNLYSLLVSFFWLVGVVAQLTLTSCGEGQRQDTQGGVCLYH